jgi:hypothetical protein
MLENNKRTGEGISPSHPNRESERLRRDIYRPDIEKLKLFTKMLRQNALFKKAKISHK